MVRGEIIQPEHAVVIPGAVLTVQETMNSLAPISAEVMEEAQKYLAVPVEQVMREMFNLGNDHLSALVPLKGQIIKDERNSSTGRPSFLTLDEVWSKFNNKLAEYAGRSQVPEEISFAAICKLQLQEIYGFSLTFERLMDFMLGGNDSEKALQYIRAVSDFLAGRTLISESKSRNRAVSENSQANPDGFDYLDLFYDDSKSIAKIELAPVEIISQILGGERKKGNEMPPIFRAVMEKTALLARYTIEVRGIIEEATKNLQETVQTDLRTANNHVQSTGQEGIALEEDLEQAKDQRNAARSKLEQYQGVTGQFEQRMRSSQTLADCSARVAELQAKVISVSTQTTVAEFMLLATDDRTKLMAAQLNNLRRIHDGICYSTIASAIMFQKVFTDIATFLAQVQLVRNRAQIQAVAQRYQESIFQIPAKIIADVSSKYNVDLGLPEGMKS